MHVNDGDVSQVVPGVFDIFWIFLSIFFSIFHFFQYFSVFLNIFQYVSAPTAGAMAVDSIAQVPSLHPECLGLRRVVTFQILSDPFRSFHLFQCVFSVKGMI